MSTTCPSADLLPPRASPRARREVVRAGYRADLAAWTGVYPAELTTDSQTCTRLGTISQDPIGFAAGDANLYRYVGNEPTVSTDPSGLVELPAIPDRQGHTHRYPLIPTGSRGSDNAALDKLAQGTNAKFSRNASNGIWHHKSFNKRTGEFAMVFVDAAEHASKRHIGGFATWTDWVVDVVENGKIDKLNPNQLQALQNGFSYREGTLDCFSKLSKLGISVSIVTDSADEISEIVFKKGGTELGRVGSRIAAGHLVRYAGQASLRIGARAVPIIFVLGAAGNAVAEDGDTIDIAAAVGREVFSADLVEFGVQVVVLDGIGKPIAQHMYSGKRMRQAIAKYGTETDVNVYNHYWQQHMNRLFGSESCE